MYRVNAHKLPDAERRLLKDRWGNRRFRSQALNVGEIALVLALFNSAGLSRIQDIPVWAPFVTWAITLPLLVGGWIRWSVRLLQKDPETWRNLMTAVRTDRTKKESWRLAKWTIVLIFPGVLFMAAVSNGGL